MADLMVAMAKTVVEAALTRAQAAIEGESRLRERSQRNLVLVTLELEMIHSFLQVATGERLRNMIVRTWVKQVREMAYDFQDCVEFVVHLDNRTRWWLRMIPSSMAPTLPLDQAVADLEDLKFRAEELSKYYRRYNRITDSEPKIVTMQQEASIPEGYPLAMDLLLDARGVTKRQQRFLNLTGLITKGQRDGHPQVISVWGAAGDHGTTSIIRTSYNHPQICQDFPFRSWVKILHPFSPHQFMRDMIAQFHATSCMEQGTTIGRDAFEKMEATQQDLFTEFEKQLKDKRYLIVLEGLSHINDWDAIRAFLPDNINGSCIIVSTKQSEIATLCIKYSYQVAELKRFSDQHSVCALYKACQGHGDEDKNAIGYDGDEDKGKEQMASLENRIRENKIMSLQEEAKEWKEKNGGLVGQESRMSELVQCLAEARVNALPVMSVWGIAQVGKSALVKKIFYDTVLQLRDGRYEDYYWVDVAHPFNMRDLYLTLLSDFHSGKDPTEECHRLLKKGWCLIVIDDLQSTKDWDMIQPALVAKHLKSVVIVITTDPTIAAYCTNDKGLVFNVKALEADASFDLFKQQVLKWSPYPFMYQEADVKDLLSKCGGLPKRFMKHLENDLEFYNLQNLFGWMHSFFLTCPDALKPCIFYLSIFPQDRVIRRRRLLRRWVAEGYTWDRNHKYAEKNGEKHFSKLLKLSIIQKQSSQWSSSSVNSSVFNVDAVSSVMYLMNGFIREYVLSRQMEENLVLELGEKCTLSTQRTGRHLIILDKWERDRVVFASMEFSRLRSLTVFGGWESFFISKSMKVLRVLDLENAEALKDGDLDNILEWLCRLKFLSLRGHKEIKHLPGSLCLLRQLQTLDVRGTSITTLPKNITKLQKLQYIRAGTRTIDIEPPVSSSKCSRLPEFCRCHHPTISVEVPTKIGELTALHTLGVVNITASGAKKTVKELKKLTQLSKLGVSGMNGKNSSDFFSAIQNHAHLESLSISLNKRCSCFRKDNNNQGCLNEMISLPCANLRSLKLYGLEDKLPKWENDQFEKLAKLKLEMTSLPEDAMEFLGRLPELCILRVKQHQDGDLNFCVKVNGYEDDSYTKVKILEISCSSSLRVTFGSCTMRKLELLKVDCPNATAFQFSGVDNLKELKEVLLVDGPNAETQKKHLEDNFPNKNKPVVKLVEPPNSF